MRPSTIRTRHRPTCAALGYTCTMEVRAAPSFTSSPDVSSATCRKILHLPRGMRSLFRPFQPSPLRHRPFSTRIVGRVHVICFRGPLITSWVRVALRLVIPFVGVLVTTKCSCGPSIDQISRAWALAATSSFGFRASTRSARFGIMMVPADTVLRDRLTRQ
jgi:hypothetical protein